MNPAEVLAIEIRQYVGTGVRTLVPSVIPSSKRAAGTSNSRSSFQWNRESFLNALLRRRGVEAVSIAEQIMERASICCPTIWWGNGQQDGSCYVGISHNGVKYPLFALWTAGDVQLRCQTLQQRGIPPQDIGRFISSLNQIPEIEMLEDGT
jgi:hypothetical protein